LTTSLDIARRHASAKHKPEPQQPPRCCWEECLLQTFFAETKDVNYFVIEDCERETSAGDTTAAGTSALLEQVERQLEERSGNYGVQQTILGEC